MSASSASGTCAASNVLLMCSVAGRGARSRCPAGGFYLWFDAGDGWDFTERLASEGGALVSPGDFYGAGGTQLRARRRGTT